MSGKAKEIAGLSRRSETREPRIPWLGQLRGGIAARLLLFVVLFSSIVTLILTAVQLYLDYRYDVSTIEQRLGEIEKGYRNSLAEGLWQLDRKQLQLQIEGIASLPDVSYAQVSEASAAAAPLTVAAGHKSDGHVLRREIPVVYPGSGGPQIIGRFVVEASLEGVYRRLLQNGIVILISQGAKTFLVSIFIVFIFYRLVGRHRAGGWRL
jgi:hypothetical protein